MGSLVHERHQKELLQEAAHGTRVQSSVNPATVKRWESPRKSRGFTDDYYGR
jgi:hypothetical protein